MTKNNCIYWQGEGCIIEVMEGIKCRYMNNDFVPQCKASNKDLAGD